MAEASRQRRKRLTAFRALLVALYAAGLGTFMALLAMGSSYYATPLAERPRHPDYWDLKPGGRLGIVYGVTGAAMMTVMHLYSVRKRVRPLRRLGPLARWLDLHILMGVLGPLYIVLHTSFKTGGIAALSFWSMVAVALSGVFGRYLYLQIPRTRAGEALTLKEVEAEDQELSHRLREEFGLDEARLAELQELASPSAPRGGLLSSLWRALRDDLGPGRRRKIRAFTAALPGVPKPLRGELRRLLRQKSLLRRRILMWDAMQRLFHHWHVVHKPFAIVMYVFLVAHVAAATLTGYGLRW